MSSITNCFIDAAQARAALEEFRSRPHPGSISVQSLPPNFAQGLVAAVRRYSVRS
jgi:hypothetical protein